MDEEESKNVGVLLTTCIKATKPETDRFEKDMQEFISIRGKK